LEPYAPSGTLGEAENSMMQDESPAFRGGGALKTLETLASYLSER
jgi:hypothetical protein